MSSARPDVRPSPIAGQWYPAEPARLAASVDAYLAAAEVEPVPGRVIGLLAPHAGHRYSGPVAAHAFKMLRGMEVDTVAVVGPSHYAYDAGILTTAHTAYETPLGQVPIAHELLAALRERLPLHAVRDDPEHALEIELPFLQRALESFDLLPLALIDQSLRTAQTLGAALADLLAGRRALLVASSDLSHFYPQAVAQGLDEAMLDAVEAFDAPAVLRLEDEGRGFACGRGAIAAVMIAARALGADSAQIVGYATSGETTGDYARVVGYGAAVFFQAVR